MTLPHEVEWEVAARWNGEQADGRAYPWGNEFDPEKANTEEGSMGQPTAVGLYPGGKNAVLNLYDLSGNVWEWQCNKYTNPDDDAIDQIGDRRVVRGGSWDFDLNYAPAAYRFNYHADDRYSFLGLRVMAHRSPSQ